MNLRHHLPSFYQHFLMNRRIIVQVESELSETYSSLAVAPHKCKAENAKNVKPYIAINRNGGVKSQERSQDKNKELLINVHIHLYSYNTD